MKKSWFTSLPLGAATAAAALALCCTGCSDHAPARKRLGISIPAADHGWTGGIVYWAERAKRDIAARHPDTEVIVSTARDAAEQVDKVENLLARRIQALVLLPHEPAPLLPVCRKVKQSQVFLVNVDRGLPEPVQDLYVAGDNPGFGEAGARELAARLGGKGDIVILEGIPCSVNSDRVNAFRKELQKHPGIRVLDAQSAYWDSAKALKVMENFLQKHPKIDAVWAGDDDVLLGALKAYKESKRSDVKFFIGGAGSKIAVKKILDGDPLVPFDVTYPPKMIYDAAMLAADALHGKLPPRKTIVIPAEIINRANAARFYYPDSIY